MGHQPNMEKPPPPEKDDSHGFVDYADFKLKISNKGFAGIAMC